MFPLGDATRRLDSIPIVTVLLIVINAVVFYFELQGGEAFITRWAVTPAEVAHRVHLETIITAMFMHGGWMHIIGNMIFDSSLVQTGTIQPTNGLSSGIAA
jgi:membrane associated rhomboid family serine protease